MKKLRTGIATLFVSVASASAQTVNEDIKITAFDAMSYASFGESLASDQGVLAVGAIGDDHGGAVSGSVYLYDSNPDSSTYGLILRKITTIDSEDGYFFGHSVTIGGGILAVGAIMEDEYQGVVYLFDGDPSSSTFGTQLGKLSAADKSVEDIFFLDAFGCSIKIDERTVFIGAPNDDEVEINAGAVYVYDGDPDSPSFGIQLGKITASDGVARDHFGSSIAIHQGGLAVTALGDDDRGEASGSVYIIDGDLSSSTFGSQLGKLYADLATSGGSFGSAIAIHQGVLAVGAPNESINWFGSGSVYLFDVNPESFTFGTLLRKIGASDGWINHAFGFSLSLEQGFLVVGSPGDNVTHLQTGSLYIYDVDPASPEFGLEIGKVVASDSEVNDTLGLSVSIARGVVAVGALFDEVNGLVDAGSVYILDINCSQDVNRDFVLDFFDYSAFMKLFAENDLTVDFDGNGELDFFDVDAFLQDFSAGCPIVH